MGDTYCGIQGSLHSKELTKQRKKAQVIKLLGPLLHELLIMEMLMIEQKQLTELTFTKLEPEKQLSLEVK